MNINKIEEKITQLLINSKRIVKGVKKRLKKKRNRRLFIVRKPLRSQNMIPSLKTKTRNTKEFIIKKISIVKTSYERRGITYNCIKMRFSEIRFSNKNSPFLITIFIILVSTIVLRHPQIPFPAKLAYRGGLCFLDSRSTATDAHKLNVMNPQRFNNIQVNQMIKSLIYNGVGIGTVFSIWSINLSKLKPFFCGEHLKKYRDQVLGHLELYSYFEFIKEGAGAEDMKNLLKVVDGKQYINLYCPLPAKVYETLRVSGKVVKSYPVVLAATRLLGEIAPKSIGSVHNLLVIPATVPSRSLNCVLEPVEKLLFGETVPLINILTVDIKDT